MSLRHLLASALVCVAAILPAADPAETLAVMRRVADWQLANPSKKYGPTNWVPAVGWVGFTALAGLPEQQKYQDAMVAIGERTGWKLGRECRFHADDQVVGQMYLDLAMQRKDPKMSAHTREVMNEFCARPDAIGDMQLKGGNRRWTWCDALFMAPPVLAKLYAMTGEQRYHDALMRDFRQTHDFLYDKTEHLYFRDANYFSKREANGQKVFWGRGNGWVLAGLANTLDSLPKDAPGRPYFEGIFKELAGRVVTLQQADGLWRASLLDPASYPLKESSGSALFCFGLAWGINHGLLDRATTQPVVDKAWTALVACVTPEGRLIHVQPVGQDPRKFDDNSTEVYGVGAFLLAGAQVYRL